MVVPCQSTSRALGITETFRKGRKVLVFIRSTELTEGFIRLSFKNMCCNRKPNRIFKYEFVKPFYKWLAFYECPHCGKRWFEVITDKSEEPKYYYDNAATQLYKEWKNRIDNIKQGTKANEHFYYGTFSKHGNHYKTYRTNFNNQKELIGKQKTLVIPL